MSFSLEIFSNYCVFLLSHLFFILQRAIAATWAYQDCEKPFKLSAKQATNNKALRELVEEGEKKVEAKEEELKAKAEELKAKAKELRKARAEVTQLEGELIKSRDAAAEASTLKA